MSHKKHLALQIPLHSYLFDHRFKGRAVLPAVEAMQLLAVSTRSEYPDMPVDCMRDGSFDKFLFLEDLTDPEATTVINEVEEKPDGGIRAKLITRNRLKATGITRTKEHVSLTFAKTAQPEQAPEFDRLFELAGAGFLVAAERLYSELVPFGPAYQNIDGNLKVSEEGAVAHLRAPPAKEPSDTSPQPLGFPFILDAAFHAACVWSQRYAGIVAFPVGFSERVVCQPAQPGEHYTSRVLPLPGKSQSPVLLFDIWIYTESGEPCESIRGLRMQDVSGGRWKPPQWVRSMAL